MRKHLRFILAAVAAAALVVPICTTVLLCLPGAKALSPTLPAAGDVSERQDRSDRQRMALVALGDLAAARKTAGRHGLPG